MTSGAQNTSFALFGSAARGDCDAFSDWDLLVVSDDEATLRELRGRYDATGWSCTAYSWNRLERAADQGSLFVQHLKQESKILSDPSDRLSALLHRYSAKAHYKDESNRAALLLGNLTQHLPLCDAGPMWSLDVLSVGFRSLAVANLANNGIYEFSNHGMIAGLIRIGMISEEDGCQLAALRRFKALYRRGLIDGRIPWFEIFRWVGLVDKAFTLGLSPRREHTIDIVELALDDDSIEGAIPNWYTRCRRIESALWMLTPRCNLERVEFQGRKQSLFGVVRAPNVYAWHFSEGYGSTQSRLSDLAEMSAI